MPTCCKGRTTPYCPICRADLKTNSFIGLKAHLEKRLKAASDTLKEWTNKAYTTPDAEQKVQQGIARNLRNVEQLQGWLDEVTKCLANADTGAAPEQTG